MKKTIQSSDPDIVGSWPAMKRAAKAARELAKRTGSPLYVYKDGEIIDINPLRRKRAKAAK
ncbi:MAG: hypothetical protein LLG01_01470 [Planctomycetaceae bacterium]|nr:hypothetical protein [Planctomycetaceae bacterium]